MNYLLPCCLRLCLFATSLIFHSGMVTVFAQPVTNQAVVVSLDFDADGDMDAAYEQSGVKSPNNPNYYYCAFFVRDAIHLRFLRASARDVDYGVTQPITAGHSVYVNPAGRNDVWLVSYDAEWKIPGYWDFYQSPLANFYDNKTDLLIGFRFTRLEAGGTQHHGWLRFTRPDTNFTTAFELVAYDWNPVPGQPIAAGQPPAIPLQLRVIPEGLQLEKPDGAVEWVLETTDRLGPEEDWRPVPNSQGPLILLPQHDARQFYRLRRP